MCRAFLVLALILLPIVPLAYASCDTALLVIDVQIRFLDWHPWLTASGDEIVPAIQTLLEAARLAGIEIIYIRDLSLDRRGDSDEFGIHDGIGPEEGDAVFTKRSGDALTNPDLVAYLEAGGIERLLISGIASDGCVQETLRSASRAGYEILIVTDAHAHSAGEVDRTQATNRTWLGWGLAGAPMAEIDWAAFGCVDDAEAPTSDDSAELP
jgi:nicotinamidase-related amidase